MLSTCLAVSADSLFAGIALGADGRTGLQKNIASAMLAVALLAISAALFGEYLSTAATLSRCICGALLVLLGASYLVKKEESAVFVRKRRVITLAESFISGICVGLDGASACLSLTALYPSALPLIAVVSLHYLFLEVGALLTPKKLSKRTCMNISGTVLVFIGARALI